LAIEAPPVQRERCALSEFDVDEDLFHELWGVHRSKTVRFFVTADGTVGKFDTPFN
jgi:hypothetical protein